MCYRLLCAHTLLNICSKQQFYIHIIAKNVTDNIKFVYFLFFSTEENPLRDNERNLSFRIIVISYHFPRREMLSALTSLIWGTDGETPNLEESAPEKSSADDHVELDNDWIFIRPKGK